MDGKRLIEKISLRNILSFGDKGEEITLEPLNIIIGQNASGKSNLVDVIKLLRSLPQENGLVNFISKSGGIVEWLWKGFPNDLIFEIEIEVAKMDYRFSYRLELIYVLDRIGIYQETLSEINAAVPKNKLESKLFRSQPKELIKNQKNINPDYSMFSPKFSEQDIRTKLAYTSIYSAIITPKIYTDLQTNRNSEIRRHQPSDSLNDFLEEDGSNLALVLNDLQFRGRPKDKIVENLKKFNPHITDYVIQVIGGTVQLFIREEGLEKPISAMRLSDGTLRYLCLLAILCHPEPPPLICIEEPETGLHPDILPTIAELMIEASQRTQLIVTTHSDILVSAFSKIPEAVLVCEKDEDGTHFKRLEADKLKVWLKEYELGDLWLKGEIGGKRW
jgi:predicted ATPase